MITLEDKVKALAEARKRERILREQMAEKIEANGIAFRDANRELQAQVSAAQDSLVALEAEVRAEACAAFGATGEKNPAPGVTVVVSTKYDYTADEALKWAMNHNTALTLDKKAFGEVCKSDRLRPDFVTVVQEPSARIATDLEKALAEEAAA